MSSFCHDSVIPTSSFCHDNLKCRKCNKKLASRQSRYTHEKTCKYNIFINDQFKLLSDKIEKLESKNINSNNSNNGNNNSNNITDNSKKIIINYSPGTEPIDHLTIDQQKGIMNKGLNSLLDIIKLTNFDKDKPEYFLNKIKDFI